MRDQLDDLIKDCTLTLIPVLFVKLSSINALITFAWSRPEPTQSVSAAPSESSDDKKTVLLTMRDQLDDLIKDNEYFVRVITSYKINVRACGNWSIRLYACHLNDTAVNVIEPLHRLFYQPDDFREIAKHWLQCQGESRLTVRFRLQRCPIMSFLMRRAGR